MKQYYECHITMLGDPEKIKAVVEPTKWKFSAIDGDPVMGDGVKCYATMLYNIKKNHKWVLDQLIFTANWIEAQGVNVIRRKIEQVIYDDRSDKVNFQCKGGCVDCHIDDFEEKQSRVKVYNPEPGVGYIHPAGVSCI